MGKTCQGFGFESSFVVGSQQARQGLGLACVEMGDQRTSETVTHGGEFLWTLDEAESKQVTQIGASACGATAVINTLVHKLCLFIE